ncbi:MAG: hypothetical protein H6Q15_2081 [Bacteroidetes bacterium]|nr:hypothetical protein [Bacteroidota bacterium]
MTTPVQKELETMEKEMESLVLQRRAQIQNNQPWEETNKKIAQLSLKIDSKKRFLSSIQKEAAADRESRVLNIQIKY